ncbi:MAG: hypothetical protein ABI647_10765 [Gemmatimonadota bacterium]
MRKPDGSTTMLCGLMSFRVTLDQDSVLGGRLAAEIDADFFGGQQPSSGGRTHPLLRLRRAVAEVRWRGGAILIGQEAPPISELNPVSVASVGFPEFSASSNLWLWLPQVRALAWLNRGRRVRLGLEATALAPNAATAQPAFLTEPDSAEATGRPAFEGRMLMRWGTGDTRGELSVGGHIGWLRSLGGNQVTSRALAVSLRAPLSTHFEIRAEAFHGRALAGLGGGGVGQSLTTSGDALVTTGGWLQLVAKPASSLELALGAGTDHPRTSAGAVPSGNRLRNSELSGQLLWRAEPLFVGLGIRHLATRYGAPLGSTVKNTQLNLALGVEF